MPICHKNLKCARVLVLEAFKNVLEPMLTITGGGQVNFTPRLLYLSAIFKLRLLYLSELQQLGKAKLFAACKSFCGSQRLATNA